MVGTYLDWSIGGLIPTWIVDVKWGFGGASSSSGSSAGRADSTVTLHCATKTRDEIETFKTLMTPVFTNTNLLNGGTDLQVTPDGQILTIVNGSYTWNGIISSVQFDEDEYATIDGDAAIEFDIILELQRGAGAISENVACVPAQMTDNAIQISAGFDQPDQMIGEKIDLGSTPGGVTINGDFNTGCVCFNWDGTGRVFIVSDPTADPTTNTIFTDDAMTVTNKTNSQSLYATSGNVGNGQAQYPAPEITSILQAGNNCVNVVIQDLYGDLIGCSALYIVQYEGTGSGLSSGTGTGSGSGSGGSGSGSNLVKVQITAGFASTTEVQGNDWNVGKFTFNWNGQGKIYLASQQEVSNPTLDFIQFFESATIAGNLGAIATGNNVIPDFDITSICQTGNNTIDITIHSSGNATIGSGPLWIIQINS
jgi:hypothetical protein